MSSHKNPWTTVSIQEMYNNPWLKVSEHQVITPTGEPGIYGKVSFKNKAVGIIPLDKEDHTWLVGQYRYCLDQYSWEIPMGGSPLGTDPVETAQRELKEETGISAGQFQEILHVHTTNSVTDEEGWVYLATELSFGEPEFDHTEQLEIRRLSFDEALEMARTGEITDAMSVAGLFRLALDR